MKPKPQNTTHAVMAQRNPDDRDAPDDFPTPPWAVRALLEHVIGKDSVKDLSCLEPACGRGFMASVLSEYFLCVEAFDIHDYGSNDIADYLSYPDEDRCYDWVITNPPFRLTEEFVLRSLAVARIGVAMLTRTSFIESKGRYKRLFKPFPPSAVAQFTERVPMVKGRLDGKASTATSYCWIVWDRLAAGGTSLQWIPPCRKWLERPEDYVNL
jgi:hypothetical protein